MIYVIIGPSCSGKSTLVVNTFIKGHECKEFKDVLPVCETESAFLVGKWFDKRRVKGLDRISRAEIPKIIDQVKRLLPIGKDIILEGDKIASRKFFQELLETGVQCQLLWCKCSKETSVSRARKNGSTQQESSIKAVAQKAENIFYEFAAEMNGGIIDTEALEDGDWEDFSIKNSYPEFPYKDAGKRDCREDFAIFILTHGRAENVVTMRALKRLGYSGKWYMVIDNEDEKAPMYYEKYGKDHVIMFDKKNVVDRTDTMDNFENHKAIIYARNESFNIAKQLGLTYFLMLDDDYASIDRRKIVDGLFKTIRLKPGMFDEIIDEMIEFLETSGCKTIAFCQNGDFIGGGSNQNFWKHGLLRKAMNSFFCKTDNPIEFRGTMNEDVVTYTTLGSRGNLFFSYPKVSVRQLETQSLKGGMSDEYAESGTYIKSFYAVMSMPSSVKIGIISGGHTRIHHNVTWNNCVPKIISEEHRKGEW